MKWSSIFSRVPSDRKKWETNSGLWSEVTCVRAPCLVKMCVRKSWESLGDVIASLVGMNRASFVRRSNTTKMDEWLLEMGSCSMKSMDMEFHGLIGMGSCFSSP